MQQGRVFFDIMIKKGKYLFNIREKIKKKKIMDSITNYSEGAGNIVVKASTKSWTFSRSIRKTPPVPAQLPFNPNEVTPATTLLSPKKLGPPESPKQVPPVAWLLVNSREKSPTVLLTAGHCTNNFPGTPYSGMRVFTESDVDKKCWLGRIRIYVRIAIVL